MVIVKNQENILSINVSPLGVIGDIEFLITNQSTNVEISFNITPILSNNRFISFSIDDTNLSLGMYEYLLKSDDEVINKGILKVTNDEPSNEQFYVTDEDRDIIFYNE